MMGTAAAVCAVSHYPGTVRHRTDLEPHGAQNRFVERIMANLLARIRQSGSFIAGLLIGSSVVVATFAATDSGPGRWPIMLALGAPVVLAVGLALQALVVSGVLRHMANGPAR
jgi:hypothetical protein